MKFIQLLFIFLIGITIGCKQNSTPSEVNEKGAYFGEKISDVEAIKFEDLLLKMTEMDTVEATVIGKVESVCQAKGCWMNIVSTDIDNPGEMFVKFKDYGFFMPLDISGKQVVMRGKAYKEETTVDELRHYAEDEGKSEEEIAEIIEPIVELKFMADGVILKL